MQQCYMQLNVYHIRIASSHRYIRQRIRAENILLLVQSLRNIRPQLIQSAGYVAS